MVQVPLGFSNDTTRCWSNLLSSMVVEAKDSKFSPVIWDIRAPGTMSTLRYVWSNASLFKMMASASIPAREVGGNCPYARQSDAACAGVPCKTRGVPRCCHAYCWGNGLPFVSPSPSFGAVVIAFSNCLLRSLAPVLMVFMLFA